ncbi:MAG: hypothetical protein ACRESG_02175 [Gammaproteobacteria bacterium]
MKLKLIAYGATLAFAGSLLAACGGSSSVSNNPKPPPPPSTVNFTAFVKTQLLKSGDAFPTEVNGVDFTFPDLDNPDAYNDVLPPPSSSGG